MFAFNRAKKERAWRKAHLDEFPDLRPVTDQRMRAEQAGELVVSISGTAATRIFPGFVTACVGTGTVSGINRILLNEPDVSERRQCLQDMRAELRRKTTVAEYPLIVEGLGGRTIGEAVSDTVLPLWLPDNQTNTTRFVQDIDRVVGTTGVSPAVHAALLPAGGSVVLGKGPIAAVKHHYPGIETVAVFFLDIKDIVRERFEATYQYLCADEDNLGSFLFDGALHREDNDFGLQYVFAGMQSGGWLSGDTLNVLNAMKYVFDKERGHKFATLSVHRDTVPTNYRPAIRSLPELHLSSRAMLETKAVHGVLEVLHNPRLQGIALPRAAKGSTAVVLVFLPTTPESTARITPELNARIMPAVWAYDRNVIVQYVSMAHHLVPNEPVELSVVLLQPLAATPEEVQAYVEHTMVGKVRNQTIVREVKQRSVARKKISRNNSHKALPADTRQRIVSGKEKSS